MIKNKNYLNRIVQVVVFSIFVTANLSVSTAASNENPKHDEKVTEELVPNSVGPDKAVTEATQKDGLKLSEIALKTLGIKTKKIQSKEIHHLPVASVLFYQADSGVYRLRSGWFKLIEGKVISRSTTELTFKSPDLLPGDEVVIESAQLLRLAELNIWSGGGDAD